MAEIVRLDDLRGGYVELVEFVRKNGEKTAPRGLPTLEVPDVTVELRDWTDALPLGVGRNASTRLAAYEALALQAETSDPALAARVAPGLMAFAQEDTGRFHGAYGERVADQVRRAVLRLQRDPDSRRAVVQVWDKRHDTFTGQDEDLIRDYPCTLAVQFRLRDGTLDMSTIMRSNDVWRGVAYDLFQWTQLGLAVARCLRVEPGRYSHHSLSLHMYESDLAAADGLETPAPGSKAPLDFVDGVGSGKRDWALIVQRARQILSGELPGFASDAERWYLGRLHG